MGLGPGYGTLTQARGGTKRRACDCKEAALARVLANKKKREEKLRQKNERTLGKAPETGVAEGSDTN